MNSSPTTRERVRRSLVIDTDTASDDAVALVQAIRHPDARVRAVTVVAGNVPLACAVRNALVTCDLAGGGEVPVHAGCAAPLLRPAETAQQVHGPDGMSEVPLPEPRRGVEATHAAQALVELARREAGEHELVTLGPLTNIAVALQLDPLLLTRFRRTTLMLGAPDGRGNVGAVGEFNAWADPEAAAIVLAAPGEKTLVGWDVSRTQAVIDDERAAELAALGALGRFAVDVNAAVRRWGVEVTGIGGYDLPDAIAMAVAIEPDGVVESEQVFLQVSRDEATRGLTFPDRRLPPRAPNVTLVRRVREGLLMDQLRTVLAS